ncbi:MAG: hypothetical protein ACLUD2_04075 [Clostridium sp.]
MENPGEAVLDQRAPTGFRDYIAGVQLNREQIRARKTSETVEFHHQQHEH